MTERCGRVVGMSTGLLARGMYRPPCGQILMDPSPVSATRNLMHFEYVLTDTPTPPSFSTVSTILTSISPRVIDTYFQPYFAPCFFCIFLNSLFLSSSSNLFNSFSLRLALSALFFAARFSSAVSSGGASSFCRVLNSLSRSRSTVFRVLTSFRATYLSGGVSETRWGLTSGLMRFCLSMRSTMFNATWIHALTASTCSLFLGL